MYRVEMIENGVFYAHNYQHILINHHAEWVKCWLDDRHPIVYFLPILERFEIYDNNDKIIFKSLSRKGRR